MPLRGPAEATEAMRGPAILAGEGAGANGFGDFRRSRRMRWSDRPGNTPSRQRLIIRRGLEAHAPGSASPGPAHYMYSVHPPPLIGTPKPSVPLA